MGPTSPSAARRRREGLKSCEGTIAVFVLTCVALVNAGFPMIRLHGVTNDYVATLVCIAVLVASGLRLVVCARRRWVVTLLVLPVFVCAGMVALASNFYLTATGNTSGQFDPSLVPLKSLPVQYGRFVVYRTNLGAWARFGVDVRHELDLVPGVMLVRRLGYSSNMDDAQVTVTSGAARISYLHDGESQFEDIVTIRRFVWF